MLMITAQCTSVSPPPPVPSYESRRRNGSNIISSKAQKSGTMSPSSPLSSSSIERDENEQDASVAVVEQYRPQTARPSSRQQSPARSLIRHRSGSQLASMAIVHNATKVAAAAAATGIVSPNRSRPTTVSSSTATENTPAPAASGVKHARSVSDESNSSSPRSRSSVDSTPTPSGYETPGSIWNRLIREEDEYERKVKELQEQLRAKRAQNCSSEDDNSDEDDDNPTYNQFRRDPHKIREMLRSFSYNIPSPRDSPSTHDSPRDCLSPVNNNHNVPLVRQSPHATPPAPAYVATLPLSGIPLNIPPLYSSRGAVVVVDHDESCESGYTSGEDFATAMSKLAQRNLSRGYDTFAFGAMSESEDDRSSAVGSTAAASGDEYDEREGSKQIISPQKSGVIYNDQELEENKANPPISPTRA